MIFEDQAARTNTWAQPGPVINGQQELTPVGLIPGVFYLI